MKKTKKTTCVEDSIESVLRWHTIRVSDMWDCIKTKYCVEVFDQVYYKIRLPVEHTIDDQCVSLIKEMINEK